MPQVTLLKPLLTEKTMRLAQAGQFTFLVAKQASKPAVARAVTEQFKVTVLRVTSAADQGKTRKTGKRRIASNIAAGKKAVVTLKAGETIEFFKVPEEKGKKKQKKL